MVHIFILSDSTGKTAEQALHAALTQFSETEVDITLHRNIRTEDQVVQIVTQAEKTGAFIIHTVVSTSLRNFISKIGRLHNVETIDLMGPLLAQLSQQFANSPSEEPGLFRKLNRAYFQRIEAMEFVLRHDDGQRIHELNRAEIVLVGVSRTFKTPISIFLAMKGWMTANVPIILDVKPPPELLELPATRVFGLTTDARNLAILRRVRHDYLGGAVG
ncbi:MAG: pyruvate, water dikinase regulatory protein, partial [bacterium]|nr:pyruvate, water dikinase regulatory protein [bacterium]